MSDANGPSGELLAKLRPRSTDAKLRRRVLEAVAEEFDVGRKRRRQRRIGLAVAASVLLAVVLNVWLARSADARLAELYGPVPVPAYVREVVETVESVTDAETARWFEQQLTAAWRSHIAARGPASPGSLPTVHGPETP